MKNGTAHVACKCQHKFQDDTYGKGVRVANTLAKKQGDKSDAIDVRCTVCAAIHHIKESEVR